MIRGCHPVARAWISLVCALLLGCSEPKSIDCAEFNSAASAPSVEEIGYVFFHGLQIDPVVLTAGYWEGEPYVPGGVSRPTVNLVEQFYLSGDLNGDRMPEAVVILRESGGGSGNFSYLAAVGWKDNELVNLGTSLIGDRVRIQGGEITDQEIALKVLQQRPGDAVCCPTQNALRRWTLQNASLDEQGVTLID